MKAARDDVVFFVTRAFNEYWETARENDDKFKTRTADEFIKDFGLFLHEADNLTAPPAYAGLGKPELRSPMATAILTGAEYDYLKKHPSECPPHLQEEFTRTQQWERRSQSAKLAALKRKKGK